MEPADPTLRATLLAALSRARGRDEARAAIDTARSHSAAGPHAARRALASIAADRAALDTLVWPAVEAVRDALRAVDAELDRALTAGLLRDPVEALRADLESCGDDAVRAERALQAFW